jgi:hypothetical protein
MLSILSGMANPAKPELTDDEGGTDGVADAVDAADTGPATGSDPTVTDTTDATDGTDEGAAAGADVDAISGTATGDAATTAASSDAASTSATASADAPAASAAASSGSSTARSAGATSAPKKVLPPKAKAKAKVAAGNSQITPSRHTPSQPSATRRPPSPRWVPVLMFALWGLGLLLIVLNYMGVLPGAEDAGNGWYLVAGLVSILGGIMVATQYH